MSERIEGIDEIEKEFKDAIKDNYDPINNDSAKLYIDYIIATILLEHSKNFKNTNIQFQGRYKSPKSFINKVAGRIEKEDSITIQNGESEKSEKKVRPITDVFGMKMIITNTSKIPDPGSKISNRRLENAKILEDMTEFNQTLFGKNRTITKLQYYSNLKKLENALIGTIPQECTELRKHYQDKYKSIKYIIDTIIAEGKENNQVEDSDLHKFSKENSKEDFSELLDDFADRKDDEFYLNLITEQVQKLLNDSDLLKSLGVKEALIHFQKTEMGYISNQLKLETLIGPIEIQLQSLHQFIEGTTGFSSHQSYKPFKLPPLPKNPNEINEYIEGNKYIIPITITAAKSLMSTEPTAIITRNTDYISLKSLVMCDKNAPEYNYYEEYFERAYKIYKEDSPKETSIQEGDIINYINSPEFEKIKNKCNTFKEEIKEEKNDSEDIDI